MNESLVRANAGDAFQIANAPLARAEGESELRHQVRVRSTTSLVSAIADSARLAAWGRPLDIKSVDVDERAIAGLAELERDSVLLCGSAKRYAEIADKDTIGARSVDDELPWTQDFVLRAASHVNQRVPGAFSDEALAAIERMGE